MARHDFKTWEGRLEFRYLSDLPLEKILATACSAPPGSIVFGGDYQRETYGNVWEGVSHVIEMETRILNERR
jgi:hypothetical protein